MNTSLDELVCLYVYEQHRAARARVQTAFRLARAYDATTSVVDLEVAVQAHTEARAERRSREAWAALTDRLDRR